MRAAFRAARFFLIGERGGERRAIFRCMRNESDLGRPQAGIMTRAFRLDNGRLASPCRPPRADRAPTAARPCRRGIAAHSCGNPPHVHSGPAQRIGLAAAASDRRANPCAPIAIIGRKNSAHARDRKNTRDASAETAGKRTARPPRRPPRPSPSRELPLCYVRMLKKMRHCTIT
ncbi:hypothetical protein [Burkholderia thailandensis]|uniref:hypothetical protein n=1 Tax=Burkholderia thailandensis TaxID=57975 RepID=UPI0002E4120C|nr:hypothetical protein [Burkholderia thailandensis]